MKNIAIINTIRDRSTGKIAVNLHNFAKRNEYNSYMCYGRGEKTSDNSYYRIDSPIEVFIHFLLARVTGLQGYFSYFATRRLIKFIKNHHIDTVFAVSLHGYYLNQPLLFRFLSESDISFVYIMIDEYPYLGKCGGRKDCNNYVDECRHCPRVRDYPQSLIFDTAHRIYKMKERYYTILNKSVFVGPQFVIDEAKKTMILKDKHLTALDEAIDTSLFKPIKDGHFLKDNGIDINKVIISCVGDKGLEYFIELVKRFSVDDRYEFVHAGLPKLPEYSAKNYHTFGYITDQTVLADIYSSSDLLVFPSLQDTMPNTCLESLSCGTPLLCFNISGMPYIADSSTASFIKANDVDEGARIIQSIRKKTQGTIDTCRKYAVKRYDMIEYNRKLLEIGNGVNCL